MTRREALGWFRDYGGLIGGVGGLAGFLAALVYAFGFTVGTPEEAFASLRARVTVLEVQQDGLVGLQRYFCYRDPDAAPLFIPCDRLNGNKVPGQ